MFGDAPESAGAALRRTTSWSAETHLIQILEPKEMRPGLEGEFLLEDVETREQRRMWLTKRDMERYARAFDDFLEDIRQTCMRTQTNYLPWTTDQPFEDMFIALLSRGSQLAGN